MYWLLAAFAISACSITLTRSAMMIPFRRLFVGTIFEELVRCHYCTSHWLALAVAVTYRQYVGGVFVADLVLGWFALVGMSALISGIIMFFTPFTSEE